MSPRAALLALLLAAAPAAGQDGAPGAPEGNNRQEFIDDRNARAKSELEGDPAARENLADRIMASKLAAQLTGGDLGPAGRKKVLDWISEDLESAAAIDVGLRMDEENGNTVFQDRLTREYNKAARKRGDPASMGVLRSAARTSKLVNKAMQDASGEEQRELLKNLFEGKGGQSGQVITGEAPEGKAASDAPAPAAAAGLSGGYYDRLSAANIRGYSPQLVAMQSALNQRRPPNAPRLIETGKLDHATLAYPAFGLRWDAGNLEERLRRERVLALAALAGASPSAKDLADPNYEARLKADASRLPPRLSARAATLARAAAAIADFEAAAAAAKDPSKISKRLLVDLSLRQREAARWITLAAIEEDLSRADSDDGFLTPELLAAVEAAPAPAEMKAAYKKRLESLRDAHARLKSNGEAAAAALRSDAWTASLAQVERLLSENRGLKAGLSRDITVGRRAPFGVAESRQVLPRWRVLLEDAAIKWAPSLSFSREAAGRRGRLARWLKVFAVFASGDMTTAHAAYSAAEAGR